MFNMIKELVLTPLNEVYLVGTTHSSSSEELDELKRIIVSYCPDVVLLEGNFDKATFASEEESIKGGNEMGYVSFVCKSLGISLFSNDPLNEETFNFVREKFGEVLARGYFELRDFEFNPSRFQDIKQLSFLINGTLGEEFDEDKSYRDYFNPLLSLNKFNEVTRKLNKFRDDFMLGKILVLMKPNKKLLVIKGENHIKENLEEMKKAIENAS